MATSGVHGDIKRIAGLVSGFNVLKSAEFRERLNRQLAEEARTQVAESFEQGVDPYGRPWLRSGRGGETLRDTGRMLSSIAPTYITSSGFRLSSNVKYAAIHNYGGIIRAKTSKGLVFRLRIGTTFIGAEGQRLKRRRGLYRWVRLMQVRIPRRTFIPIGNRLGRRWTAAFRDVIRLMTTDAVEGA